MPKHDGARRRPLTVVQEMAIAAARCTELRLHPLLAELRREHGFSQQDIVDAVGVTPDMVRRWETGRAVPGGQHLVKLMALYGLTLDDVTR